MDNQTGLPGGTIGRAAADSGAANRWIRPGWEKDPKDRKLERTTMRWDETGWYVVTAGNRGSHGSREPCAIRRSGPYVQIWEASDRIEAETDAELTELGRDLTNEEQTAVDATIREGLTQRLYAASQEWVLQTEGNLAKGGAAGANADQSWQHQELLDFHETEHAPDLYDLNQKVLEAAEAYRRWLET